MVICLRLRQTKNRRNLVVSNSEGEYTMVKFGLSNICSRSKFWSKKILLVEDNAGWHRSKSLKVPPGIEIEYLPAYSPELQPAERLWQLVGEPLVNQCFETIEEIEEILVNRCNFLRKKMQEQIKKLTNYHWLIH